MGRRKCILSYLPPLSLSSKFSHVMATLCVSSLRDGLSVSKSVHRSSGVAGSGPPSSVEVVLLLFLLLLRKEYLLLLQKEYLLLGFPLWYLRYSAVMLPSVTFL
ncbi:unnamed protein product [Brassica oleracea]